MLRLAERRAALLLAALIAVRCSGGGATELEPIPEPDLARLETGVAERLANAAKAANAIAADPSADADARAVAIGELGQLYHAYDMFDAAIPCYRNAERLQPSEAKWPYLLARALHSSFAFEEAGAAYARALEAAPRDPAIRLAKARFHREQRQQDEAQRLAKEVYREIPDSTSALMLLAELAAERGDYTSATQFYERLLELQPHALRLHQPLAMAWRARGDLERARMHQALVAPGWPRVEDPMMGAVAALAASSNRAVVDQGVALYRAGDFEGAIAAFSQAVASDPSFVGARTNLGSALARVARFDEAREQFEQVLELEPRHVLARYNLGVIAVRQGRVEEGIRYYEDALAVDPGYRDARYNLANALRATGRGEQALAHYVQIIEEDPGHAPARVGEWLCLADTRDVERLRQRIDEGLTALPSHAGIVDAAARLLAASPLDGIRDGARALTLAERLVAAARTARHLETLGMALAEVGRHSDALAAQKEAIAAAQAAGDNASVERLEANARAYERGQPCRDPAV